MRRAITHILAGTVVLGVAAGAFQQDRPALQRSGTATLTGVVVTDTENPKPVRRATVRLTDGGTSSARLAGTDDKGRFVFAGLVEGRYTLSATKPGFVETFHGSSRPGRGPGVPVAVTDGQPADVTLALVAGGVITGVISDARGRPAVGVTVTAVSLRAAGTAPTRTVTDDRGVYRLFGLAPGDYVVAAVPRLVPATLARGFDAGDVTAVTDAEIQWALGPGLARVMPPPGRPVQYAPVFFRAPKSPRSRRR